MKSPFPGMDPYIEACGLWGDFHGHLIERIFDRLAEIAPERYAVRTGKRSYLTLVEKKRQSDHAFVPDVKITSLKNAHKSGKKKSGVAVAEQNTDAVTMRAFIEVEHRERFVKIYEMTPKKRLVTIIEVLSPSNKTRGTKGWKIYQRERQSILLSDVNLVEVDLLRGGTRMPMLDDWPNSPYTILVARGNDGGYCQVWPANFQQPIPAFPVPLAKPDSDLSLDLQPMIADIYERARYAQEIDYSQKLEPPLSKDERKWLKDRLREK